MSRSILANQVIRIHFLRKLAKVGGCEKRSTTVRLATQPVRWPATHVAPRRKIRESACIRFRAGLVGKKIAKAY